MSVTQRVYISLPSDEGLTERQNGLKWAIVKRIERLHYKTEIFFDPRMSAGLATGKAWNAINVSAVMKHCVGVALIGLPPWEARMLGKLPFQLLPTEFCHYEGAIAYALGLPMLVLAQDDVEHRVIFSEGFHGHVGKIPPDADNTWLDSKGFNVVFNDWKESVQAKCFCEALQ